MHREKRCAPGRLFGRFTLALFLNFLASRGACTLWLSFSYWIKFRSWSAPPTPGDPRRPASVHPSRGWRLQDLRLLLLFGSRGGKVSSYAQVRSLEIWRNNYASCSRGTSWACQSCISSFFDFLPRGELAACGVVSFRSPEISQHSCPAPPCDFFVHVGVPGFTI